MHTVAQTQFSRYCLRYCASSLAERAFSDHARLTSVCLSRTRVDVENRQAWEDKSGTELYTHGTCDSDTIFKVKRSKVNLKGAKAYFGVLPHSLLEYIFSTHRADFCATFVALWTTKVGREVYSTSHVTLTPLSGLKGQKSTCWGYRLH